jgi:hypothetical protein
MLWCDWADEVLATPRTPVPSMKVTRSGRSARTAASSAFRCFRSSWRGCGGRPGCRRSGRRRDGDWRGGHRRRGRRTGRPRRRDDGCARSGDRWSRRSVLTAAVGVAPSVGDGACEAISAVVRRLRLSAPASASWRCSACSSKRDRRVERNWRVVSRRRSCRSARARPTCLEMVGSSWSRRCCWIFRRPCRCRIRCWSRRRLEERSGMPGSGRAWGGPVVREGLLRRGRVPICAALRRRRRGRPRVSGPTGPGRVAGLTRGALSSDRSPFGSYVR